MHCFPSMQGSQAAVKWYITKGYRIFIERYTDFRRCSLIRWCLANINSAPSQHLLFVQRACYNNAIHKLHTINQCPKAPATKHRPDTFKSTHIAVSCINWWFPTIADRLDSTQKLDSQERKMFTDTVLHDKTWHELDSAISSKQSLSFHPTTSAPNS